jgi:hypothetical protein
MPNEMKPEILSLQLPIIFEIGFFIALKIENPIFRRKTGFLYATLHGPPPKTYCEEYSGGFSDLRIILLPAPSHPEHVAG